MKEKKGSNWDVFDCSFENGPISTLLNIWVCASCSAINFLHCRTLSFFMHHDLSLIHARKVSRPSGSEKKTCRGSERSAGRERGSTASSLGKECLLVVLVGRSVTHIKRQWKLILLFKNYAIGCCHQGDFSTYSSLWHLIKLESALFKENVWFK